VNLLFEEPLLPEPRRPEAKGRPHIDPAGLSFDEYRDRCLWGPPDTGGVRQCLNAKPFRYIVRQENNHFKDGEDPHYGTWDKALECGRSYLVGDAVSMPQFLRVHSLALTDWQQMAYRWCLANPSRCLVLEARHQSRIYRVMKRGEYVVISLPYQDYGGEKDWVCRDGKTKVLVNVD